MWWLHGRYEKNLYLYELIFCLRVTELIIHHKKRVWYFCWRTLCHAYVLRFHMTYYDAVNMYSTHWDRVTLICVSELVHHSFRSPVQCQLIAWTNADLSSIRPLGTGTFRFRESIRICRLQNGGHFVPVSVSCRVKGFTKYRHIWVIKGTKNMHAL